MSELERRSVARIVEAAEQLGVEIPAEVSRLAPTSTRVNL